MTGELSEMQRDRTFVLPRCKMVIARIFHEPFKKEELRQKNFLCGLVVCIGDIGDSGFIRRLSVGCKNLIPA